MKPADPAARDLHSYARPDEVRVRHVDLDLDVLFVSKTLSGTATLTIERASGSTLTLDTRDLRIDKVECSPDGKTWTTANFAFGTANAILGTPLAVTLTRDAKQVRLHYSTSPGASALQWLEPAQTAGRTHPFLFTQSQAIHARSWIPLQDSPGVRVTYSARIRVPKPLTALMSAEAVPGDPPRRTSSSSACRRPFRPYLIALAVGDLEFRPISDRAGV